MEKYPLTPSRPGPFTQDDLGHNRPVSDKLQPYVYVAIVGVGLWYVVSAWGGFVAEDDIGNLLAVVSGLFFITIAIRALCGWRGGPAEIRMSPGNTCGSGIGRPAISEPGRAT